ncbi:MAG: DsbA family protein [Alphaproteobacteria bacterium]|nr:DsbA family protein [Alphaproteobacteria bacterium]
MATSKNSGKLFLFAMVALIGGAMGYGYFAQSSKLSAESGTAAANPQLSTEQRALLTPKPSDIILGDSNALVTIVEYSSLSCPHCAHFHEKVLPGLEKEFIDTGKVKLVMRHFPLNEPALAAAKIVECAGRNGLERNNFMKVFFNLQAQWAFGESFLKDLKQIALVGGIDSAAFDSCATDKTIETRILTMRQAAAEKLGVNSTPSFFVHGTKFVGEPSLAGLRAAIAAAGPGTPTAK